MNTTYKTRRIFQLIILSIFTIIFCETNCIALELTHEEAEKILKNTATMSWYMDINGENDYKKDDINIIRVALFGLFDAKTEFLYNQEQIVEKGKKKLPENTPLFTVNGKAVTADQVVMREDSPQLFKDISDDFMCFMTRDAVSLAALYFTGHNLKEHIAPKDNDMIGEVLLNKNGYFIGIEGMGDTATEAKLKNIAPQGNGFVLTGEVVEIASGEPSEQSTPWSFRLELAPGDAPGTWKRQFTEQGKPE